jgi:hypothetical protein
MTYYIVLKDEPIQVIQHDNRILGESTITKKFYPAGGFHVLLYLINQDSPQLETLTIIDENKKVYTIEQFFKLLNKLTIINS